MQSFLETLRLEVDQVANNKFEDENNFTNEEFEVLFPVTKDDFNDMFTYCDPIPVLGGYRYISKEDLLCFICKLRQGLSDELLNELPILYTMIHKILKQSCI